MGGISIWQLLIVLLIVIVIFGTKKLRSMGGDVGGAIKNFKKAMKEEGGEEKEKTGETAAGGRVIEGKVTDKQETPQSRDSNKV